MSNSEQRLFKISLLLVAAVCGASAGLLAAVGSLFTVVPLVIGMFTAVILIDVVGSEVDQQMEDGDSV